MEEEHGHRHASEEYMSMIQMYDARQDPTNVMRLVQEIEDRGLNLKRDEYSSVIISTCNVRRHVIRSDRIRCF